MKLNKCYNVNFGSKPLYKAKLKQPLPIIPISIKRGVFISELEPDDEQRLRNLEPYWKRTKRGVPIIRNFLHECENNFCNQNNHYKKFYIVEFPDNNPDKNFKAIAIAEHIEDFIQLSMIQSDNEKRGKNDLLKGAGSCLLYAVSKLAEMMNLNSVYIRSMPEAIPFYEKAGAKHIGTRDIDFIIKKEDFTEFQKALEEKYKIKKFSE